MRFRTGRSSGQIWRWECINAMWMLHSRAGITLLVGICVRDHRDIFVAAKTLFIIVGLEVTQGEALGLFMQFNG